MDAGVHLECVADLLGHSSVATTRRHYVRAVRPTVPPVGYLHQLDVVNLLDISSIDKFFIR